MQNNPEIVPDVDALIKFLNSSMTIEQIEAIASRKYKLKPSDCRLERMRKREQKRLFIERMMKEYKLT